MSEKVLFVDDDPNILAAYKRQLHRQFDLLTAEGAREGLDAIQKQGPFAVIVSDMRMPDINGLQFLVLARELSPQTVRMMLTGNNDLQTAVNAINEGNIFRFMNKPCSPEMMSKAVEAGIEQYRLIRAEKELIERTLKGSIKVLTDLLSLVTPIAFGRASRVRRLACEVAAKLKAEPAWQIELAAMLSQVGCLTVPEEVLHKAYVGQRLSEEDSRAFDAHPKIGSDLLHNIPRLQPVAEIILYQEKRFDGSGPPSDSRRGAEIPIGSRILKAALDFDALTNGDLSVADAMTELESRRGWYDPSVVDVLSLVVQAESHYEIKTISAREIAPGMILGNDLNTTSGLLLLAKGQEITPSLCMCLKNLASRGRAVEEPVTVLLPVRQVPQTPIQFDIHPPLQEGISHGA